MPKRTGRKSARRKKSSANTPLKESEDKDAPIEAQSSLLEEEKNAEVPSSDIEDRSSSKIYHSLRTESPLEDPKDESNDKINLNLEDASSNQYPVSSSADQLREIEIDESSNTFQKPLETNDPICQELNQSSISPLNPTKSGNPEDDDDGDKISQMEFCESKEISSSDSDEKLKEASKNLVIKLKKEDNLNVFKECDSKGEWKRETNSETFKRKLSNEVGEIEELAHEDFEGSSNLSSQKKIKKEDKIDNSVLPTESPKIEMSNIVTTGDTLECKSQKESNRDLDGQESKECNQETETLKNKRNQNEKIINEDRDQDEELLKRKYPSKSKFKDSTDSQESKEEEKLHILYKEDQEQMEASEAKTEVVTLSNDLSEVPGLSFIMEVKRSGKQPSSLYDCVLCFNSTKNSCQEWSDFRNHVRSKEHCLRVMEIENQELFKKYKVDPDAASKEMVTAILVYEKKTGRNDSAISVLEESYESQREVAEKKVSLLKEMNSATVEDGDRQKTGTDLQSGDRNQEELDTEDFEENKEFEDCYTPEMKKLRILVIGDSRVDVLIREVDKVRFHLTTRSIKNSCITNLVDEVSRVLRRRFFHVVIILGLEADLCDRKLDDQLVGAKSDFSVSKTMEIILKAQEEWTTTHPGLGIIWTVPYVPDLFRYNGTHGSAPAVMQALEYLKEEERVYLCHVSEIVKQLEENNLYHLDLNVLNQMRKGAIDVSGAPQVKEKVVHDPLMTVDGLRPNPGIAVKFIGMLTQILKKVIEDGPPLDEYAGPESPLGCTTDGGRKKDKWLQCFGDDAEGKYRILLMGDERTKFLGKESATSNFAVGTHMMSSPFLSRIIREAERVRSSKEKICDAIVIIGFHRDLCERASRDLPLGVNTAFSVDQAVEQITKAQMEWAESKSDISLVWALPLVPDLVRYNRTHGPAGSQQPFKMGASLRRREHVYSFSIAEVKRRMRDDPVEFLYVDMNSFNRRSIRGGGRPRRLEDLQRDIIHDRGLTEDGVQPSSKLSELFLRSLGRILLKESPDDGKKRDSEDRNQSRASEDRDSERRNRRRGRDSAEADEEAESLEFLDALCGPSACHRVTRGDLRRKDHKSKIWYDQVIIVSNQLYKQILSPMASNKVQILADEDMKLSNVKDFIKKHSKETVQSTLWLMLVDNLCIFKVESCEVCQEESNSCEKPLNSLHPCSDVENPECLDYVIGEIRDSIVTLLRELRSVIPSDSALFLLPPLPPVIASESLTPHDKLHSIDVGTACVYVSPESVINQLQLAFTHFNTEIVSLIIQDLKECEYSCREFESYKRKLPKSHISVVESVEDSVTTHMNSWKDCFQFMLKQFLKPPEDPQPPEPSNEYPLSKVSNELLEEGKFYDHLVFIGPQRQLDQVTPYREDLVSYWHLKFPLSIEIVDKKLSNFEPEEEKKYLFVLLADISTITAEMEEYECEALECQDTISYLTPGTTSINSMIEERMKSMKELVSRIKEKLPNSRVFLSPLRIRYCILKPKNCSDLHDELHYALSSDFHPCILDGSKGHWMSAITVLKSKWSKELQESLKYGDSYDEKLIDLIKTSSAASKSSTLIQWMALEKYPVSTKLLLDNKHFFTKIMKAALPPPTLLKEFKPDPSHSVNFENSQKEENLYEHLVFLGYDKLLDQIPIIKEKNVSFITLKFPFSLADINDTLLALKKEREKSVVFVFLADVSIIGKEVSEYQCKLLKCKDKVFYLSAGSSSSVNNGIKEKVGTIKELKLKIEETFDQCRVLFAPLRARYCMEKPSTAVSINHKDLHKAIESEFYPCIVEGSKSQWLNVAKILSTEWEMEVNESIEGEPNRLTELIKNYSDLKSKNTIHWLDLNKPPLINISINENIAFYEEFIMSVFPSCHFLEESKAELVSHTCWSSKGPGHSSKIISSLGSYSIETCQEISAFIGKIMNLRTNRHFDHAYVVGKKEFFGTFPEKEVENLNVIFHDMFPADRETLVSILRKIFPLPQNSVFILAFNISVGMLGERISHQCKANQCKNPVLVYDLEAEEHRGGSRYGSTQALVRQIKDFFELCTDLSRIAPLVIMPLFPSKVLLTEDLKQHHGISHTASRNNCFTVKGTKEMWEKHLETLVHAWNSNVKRHQSRIRNLNILPVYPYLKEAFPVMPITDIMNCEFTTEPQVWELVLNSMLHFLLRGFDYTAEIEIKQGQEWTEVPASSLLKRDDKSSTARGSTFNDTKHSKSEPVDDTLPQNSSQAEEPSKETNSVKTSKNTRSSTASQIKEDSVDSSRSELKPIDKKSSKSNLVNKLDERSCSKLSRFETKKSKTAHDEASVPITESVWSPRFKEIVATRSSEGSSNKVKDVSKKKSTSKEKSETEINPPKLVKDGERKQSSKHFTSIENKISSKEPSDKSSAINFDQSPTQSKTTENEELHKKPKTKLWQPSKKVVYKPQANTTVQEVGTLLQLMREKQKEAAQKGESSSMLKVNEAVSESSDKSRSRQTSQSDDDASYELKQSSLDRYQSSSSYQMKGTSEDSYRSNTPSSDGYKPPSDRYKPSSSDEYKPSSSDGYKPSSFDAYKSSDGYEPSSDGYKQSSDGYKQASDGYKQSSDRYKQSSSHHGRQHSIDSYNQSSSHHSNQPSTDNYKPSSSHYCRESSVDNYKASITNQSNSEIPVGNDNVQYQRDQRSVDNQPPNYNQGKENWNTSYQSNQPSSSNWSASNQTNQSSSGNWSSGYQANPPMGNWGPSYQTNQGPPYQTSQGPPGNWGPSYNSTQGDPGNWSSSYQSNQNWGPYQPNQGAPGMWPTSYPPSQSGQTTWSASYPPPQNQGHWSSQYQPDPSTWAPSYQSNQTTTTGTWSSSYQSNQTDPTNWTSSYQSTQQTDAGSWSSTPYVQSQQTTSASLNSSYQSSQPPSETKLTPTAEPLMKAPLHQSSSDVVPKIEKITVKVSNPSNDVPKEFFLAFFKAVDSQAIVSSYQDYFMVKAATLSADMIVSKLNNLLVGDTVLRAEYIDSPGRTSNLSTVQEKYISTIYDKIYPKYKSEIYEKIQQRMRENEAATPKPPEEIYPPLPDDSTSGKSRLSFNIKPTMAVKPSMPITIKLAAGSKQPPLPPPAKPSPKISPDITVPPPSLSTPLPPVSKSIVPTRAVPDLNEQSPPAVEADITPTPSAARGNISIVIPSLAISQEPPRNTKVSPSVSKPPVVVNTSVPPPVAMNTSVPLPVAMNTSVPPPLGVSTSVPLGRDNYDLGNSSALYSSSVSETVTGSTTDQSAYSSTSIVGDAGDPPLPAYSGIIPVPEVATRATLRSSSPSPPPRKRQSRSPSPRSSPQRKRHSRSPSPRRHHSRSPTPPRSSPRRRRHSRSPTPRSSPPRRRHYSRSPSRSSTRRRPSISPAGRSSRRRYSRSPSYRSSRRRYSRSPSTRSRRRYSRTPSPRRRYPSRSPSRYHRKKSRSRSRSPSVRSRHGPKHEDAYSRPKYQKVSRHSPTPPKRRSRSPPPQKVYAAAAQSSSSRHRSRSPPPEKRRRRSPPQSPQRRYQSSHPPPLATDDNAQSQWAIPQHPPSENEDRSQEGSLDSPSRGTHGSKKSMSPSRSRQQPSPPEKRPQKVQEKPRSPEESPNLEDPFYANSLKVLGAEIHKDFLKAERAMKKAHVERYAKFERYPELHPEFEALYNVFSPGYDKVYGTNAEPTRKKLFWERYLDKKLRTIRDEEWKKKREDLLRDFQVGGRQQASVKEAATSARVSIEGGGREMMGDGSFSVEGTLILLKELSGRLGMLGKTLSTTIDAARAKGVLGPEAIGMLLGNNENVALFTMVLDMMGRLYHVTQDALLDRGIRWTRKLLEMAGHGSKSCSAMPSLDVAALAKASYGKDKEFTRNLIRTALAYEGHSGHKAEEEVERVYQKVRVLHSQKAAAFEHRK